MILIQVYLGIIVIFFFSFFFFFNFKIENSLDLNPTPNNFILSF